jgi:ribosomal protein S12 methylthiotransferase accessory factor
MTRLAFDAPLPKKFRRGTHRFTAPADTLARVRPFAGQMGITRLGNVTGLDRIGIPVVVAVRPNSRSVSVSQGKGLELPQAMTSALMEAIEGFHAELAQAERSASYGQFAASHNVVDPLSLCATGRAFDIDHPIAWSLGFDLLHQEPCWVPTEIVHTDFTRPLDGYFLAGSNGLASGNHPGEAISAAICELVERDAVALWAALGAHEKARRTLDITSIDDPDCLALLAKYEGAGIAVRLWNVTTEIGIAAFLCDIRDPSNDEPRRLRRFHGSGCHPDRGIALSRALTEAAQTRLTYITGIRDDILPAEYREPPTSDLVDALLDALRLEMPAHSFRDTPRFFSDDLVEDLRWELDRLQSARFAQVVAVDLSRPDFAIPVFKVIIPGLEGDIKHPNYIPGPRANSVARSP